MKNIIDKLILFLYLYITLIFFWTWLTWVPDIFGSNFFIFYTKLVSPALYPINKLFQLLGINGYSFSGVIALFILGYLTILLEKLSNYFKEKYEKTK